MFLFQKRSLQAISFDYADQIVLLFLFFIFLSFFLNYYQFNSGKPFNHLMAYFFSFGVYYLLNKQVFKYYNDIIFFRKIIQFISWGVVFASVFAIVEFSLKNFVRFNIDQFIPRPAVEEYSPSSGIDLIVIRARSFVEESGHFAMYLECFAPICIYYLKNTLKSPLLKWLMYLMIVLAMISTFSSAGFMVTIMSFFFLLLFFNKTASSKKKLGFFVFGAMLFLIINWILDFIIGESLVANILQKLVGGRSHDDRSDRMGETLQSFINGDILHQFFGYGPAAYNTLNIEPVFVLYQVVLLEIGIVGLVLLLMFFLYHLVILFRLRNSPIAPYLMFGLISVFLHYFIIHNYFYPWLWVLCIIISLVKKNEIELL